MTLEASQKSSYINEYEYLVNYFEGVHFGYNSIEISLGIYNLLDLIEVYSTGPWQIIK